MSTLYMGADQETVAKYVLFSGDPWRVEVVKQYLENPKKVAFMREFNTGNLQRNRSDCDIDRNRRTVCCDRHGRNV